MRLTGERPIAGRTPESLLALHAAGYREVADRLGRGVVVDVGCGLADGTATLARADRGVVGMDREAGAAIIAARLHRDVAMLCGDALALPLAAAAADWVCSSHVIEHFRVPEAHVAELARVLKPGGTAFVITPNAPADFENPYHLHLFEPDELREMLARHFAAVEVCGLDGDALVKADFERRRRWARRLLRLDVVDLRHRLPHDWFVSLHALGRAVVYPVLRAAQRGRPRPPPSITADRFALTPTIDRSTLVLFAVAGKPASSSPALSR